MPEKMSILFVDDEQNILTGLKRALHRQRETWDLHFAESGEEALQIMEATGIDLVVTDMKMPNMSGLDLLKVVAKKYPTVIRFILSGQSDHDAIMESVSYAHQYLAKPFDLSTLTQTVLRVQNLRSPISDSPLLDYVTGMENLPSLPEVYLQVNEEIQSEDGSPRKIGQIIEQDPSLAASVLKYVNSSFFGLGTKIKDTHQACVYLGMDTIRALVLSEKLFSAERNPDPTIHTQLVELKEHSIQVSILTRHLANYFELPMDDVNAASTAGVMHDIGKLIILTRHEENREIGELCRAGIPQLDAELQVLGTTHADIGAYLLGIWGLPQSLTDLVAYHHNPSLTDEDQIGLLTCLHLANVFLYRKNSQHQVYGHAIYDMGYIDRLGLSPRMENIEAELTQKRGGNDD